MYSGVTCHIRTFSPAHSSVRVCVSHPFASCCDCNRPRPAHGPSCRDPSGKMLSRLATMAFRGAEHILNSIDTVQDILPVAMPGVGAEWFRRMCLLSLKTTFSYISYLGEMLHIHANTFTSSGHVPYRPNEPHQELARGGRLPVNNLVNFTGILAHTTTLVQAYSNHIALYLSIVGQILSSVRCQRRPVIS